MANILQHAIQDKEIDTAGPLVHDGRSQWCRCLRRTWRRWFFSKSPKDSLTGKSTNTADWTNELIRQIDLAAVHHARLEQLQNVKEESHADLLAAIGTGADSKLSDEVGTLRLLRNHNLQVAMVEKAWRSIDKHHARATKCLRLLSYSPKSGRYSSTLSRLTIILYCKSFNSNKPGFQERPTWYRQLADRRISTFYDFDWPYLRERLRQDAFGRANSSLDTARGIYSVKRVGLASRSIGVTKVQWDYDQEQKALRRQEDSSRPTRAATDSDVRKEWEQAKADLGLGNRWHMRGRDRKWCQDEFNRKRGAGEIDTSSDFVRHLHSAVWPEHHKLLKTAEEMFKEAQRVAMQAGLEPWVMDEDLMTFTEHAEDGSIATQSPFERTRKLGDWATADPKARLIQSERLC
ncbi:hypothetical protein LTR86_000183 [Recurvomyces mirabilis]|nr:hypothetical protein LTR86_000183 [Recurvomyces mirabilis]